MQSAEIHKGLGKLLHFLRPFQWHAWGWLGSGKGMSGLGCGVIGVYRGYGGVEWGYWEEDWSV